MFDKVNLVDATMNQSDVKAQEHETKVEAAKSAPSSSTPHVCSEQEKKEKAVAVEALAKARKAHLKVEAELKAANDKVKVATEAAEKAKKQADSMRDREAVQVAKENEIAKKSGEERKELNNQLCALQMEMGQGSTAEQSERMKKIADLDAKTEKAQDVEKKRRKDLKKKQEQREKLSKVVLAKEKQEAAKSAELVAAAEKIADEVEKCGNAMLDAEAAVALFA